MKLLALQAQRKGPRQMHREELIERLWPDISAELGLNNLHKTLHAARRTLEPGLIAGQSAQFLQMKDQMVLLGNADQVTVDVDEFESRVEQALKTGDREDLEATLAIYHGDLLPEDLYEDWVTARREQLRSQKEQLLLRLAVVREAAGDSVQAVEAYQELITLNPCNEIAHRGLISLSATMGQRHLAVEQFRVCKEILRRELDVDPEPATLKLFERVLAGEGEPRGDKSVSVPLVTPTEHESPVSIRLPGRTRIGKFTISAAAALLIILGALATYLSLIATKPAKFIAIMPLTVAADSHQLDYVAEGITEGLIDDLSRLPQVRVMARSTVYRFREKGVEPMQAAIAMKAYAVLTGSISKRGDNLALAAELVSVPEGTRIWGNRYELTPNDLISIQDRMASEIAMRLGLSLTAGDRASLSPSHPNDPAAYRLYLQARFFWNQRSKDGYLKSIDLFQSAIALDPTYARAYAGLADSYSFLGRDEAPTQDYMPLARAAAKRALEIDEKLAEAHASLAMMSNVYDWNFPVAEREFHRALELDPGYATGRLFYGVFLAAQGRLEESQSQLDQAAELDPLSPIIALCRGYPASFRGKVDAGIRAAQHALEISPGFPAAMEDLMIDLERQGRQEEAMQQAIALLIARGQTSLSETVQSVYRKSGYQAAVRAWFEAEESRASKEYVSPLRIAILAVRAGNMDKAFQWLDQAVNSRNAGLVFLVIDPKYSRLRADPRFPGICQRVGLKPRDR